MQDVCSISDCHRSREIVRSFLLFRRTTKSFHPSARSNDTGYPSNSFGKKTSETMSFLFMTPDPNQRKRGRRSLRDSRLLRDILEHDAFRFAHSLSFGNSWRIRRV